MTGLELEDRQIGCTRILFGENNGKYPDANCVLVEGAEERVLLDTTPGLVTRGRDAVGDIHRILLTHCHEDHLAGNFLFPQTPIHLHEADQPGILSLEAMLDIFGVEGLQRSRYAKLLTETFHFVPCPDAECFREGDVFDLGGGVSVEVKHTPGHTHGHCAFWIRPADILFLGDIDLSGFGPFYGDAWSSLEEFESTLERVRDLEARYYLTSHHVGLLEGRAAFLERFDRYRAKLGERESRLIDFLGEPRTLDDIAAHRFIYRPQDKVADAEDVERTMMGQHLEKLLRTGQVEEVEPGLYRTN